MNRYQKLCMVHAKRLFNQQQIDNTNYEEGSIFKLLHECNFTVYQYYKSMLSLNKHLTLDFIREGLNDYNDENGEVYEMD